MIRLEHTCCAIIVAAGNSSRMALKISKQLIPLCGIPVLAWTLMAFEKSQMVDRVVLVCRPEDLPVIQEFPSQYKLRKEIVFTPGGQTRQQSVASGISAAGMVDYYAIHDGARPLITPEEIDRVISDAYLYGAAALGTPVKDTIKVVGKDGMVLSTPDRSQLWTVQTPQVFQRELYLNALNLARNEGADYTDDCQLVERFGGKVHLCPGSYENLKLTTPEDILQGETILQKRRGQF